jgi:chorismate mutase
MDNTEEVLKACRTQIDHLDQQLITCLAKRFELSQTIGYLKMNSKVHVYQPDRAKQVRERYQRLGVTHGLTAGFMLDLFQVIHEESCRVQRSQEEYVANNMEDDAEHKGMVT